MKRNDNIIALARLGWPPGSLAYYAEKPQAQEPAPEILAADTLDFQRRPRAGLSISTISELRSIDVCIADRAAGMSDHANGSATTKVVKFY